MFCLFDCHPKEWSDSFQEKASRAFERLARPVKQDQERLVHRVVRPCTRVPEQNLIPALVPWYLGALVALVALVDLFLVPTNFPNRPV